MKEYYEHHQYSATKIKENIYHIHDATIDNPVGLHKDGTFHNTSSAYLIIDKTQVLMIDLGNPYQDNHLRELVEIIAPNKKIIVAITHNHFDHIGALEDFKEIKKYSFDNLEEKEYNIGPFTFEVIFNPGHTSDSVSYYFKEENKLFCGDFIFYQSIGRWDLPTGNINEMLKSIEKIKKLPEETIIYPGHGRETSLQYEIENNDYFNIIF